MAKPYPIVPASILDELNDLNGALGAYDKLMTAWINQTLEHGPAGDPKHFAAGCQYLLRPILEGFQSIESQVSAFRDMGVVGICTLSESDQEKP
jgi:hypothetical protein